MVAHTNRTIECSQYQELCEDGITRRREIQERVYIYTHTHNIGEKINDWGESTAR